MSSFPPTLCVEPPERPRPTPPVDLPLAALRLAGRRRHWPLFGVVPGTAQPSGGGRGLNRGKCDGLRELERGTGHNLGSAGFHYLASEAKAWPPIGILPHVELAPKGCTADPLATWRNTRPATPERATWLAEIRRDGLLYPQTGRWVDDHTLVERSPGFPQCQRVLLAVPAAEVDRRLDRLAALDAPPLHLTLRDLVPLLVAPEMESASHPLRVLRLCDLPQGEVRDQVEPARNPEGEVRGSMTALGAQRNAKGPSHAFQVNDTDTAIASGPCSGAARPTSLAPLRHARLGLPAVLCGTAGHLAGRLAGLIAHLAPSGPPWPGPRSVFDLWSPLRRLPTKASPQAVAAALGLAAKSSD